MAPAVLNSTWKTGSNDVLEKPNTWFLDGFFFPLGREQNPGSFFSLSLLYFVRSVFHRLVPISCIRFSKLKARELRKQQEGVRKAEDVIMFVRRAGSTHGIAQLHNYAVC